MRWAWGTLALVVGCASSGVIDPTEGEPASTEDAATPSPSPSSASRVDDAAPTPLEAAPTTTTADASTENGHAEASTDDAAISVPYIRVRCNAQGRLFECDQLWDGGPAIGQSNWTIVFYPISLPPVTCSSGEPPTMVCPPGTQCLGEITSGGVVTTYQGVCQ